MAAVLTAGCLTPYPIKPATWNDLQSGRRIAGLDLVRPWEEGRENELFTRVRLAQEDGRFRRLTRATLGSHELMTLEGLPPGDFHRVTVLYRLYTATRTPATVTAVIAEPPEHAELLPADLHAVSTGRAGSLLFHTDLYETGVDHVLLAIPRGAASARAVLLLRDPSAFFALSTHVRWAEVRAAWFARLKENDLQGVTALISRIEGLDQAEDLRGALETAVTRRLAGWKRRFEEASPSGRYDLFRAAYLDVTAPGQPPSFVNGGREMLAGFAVRLVQVAREAAYGDPVAAIVEEIQAAARRAPPDLQRMEERLRALRHELDAAAGRLR